jgi:YspA, cpYpsA-related SLOG family
MSQPKEFKLIIAGGRDYGDYNHMSRVLIAMADTEFADYAVSIVSGMAKGADALGVRFAKEHNVKLYQFPADWRPDGIYNPRAGFERNADMGLFANGLLAFWDGESKGTKHMIEYMRKLKKPVHIVPYNVTADINEGPPWEESVFPHPNQGV